MFRCFFCNHEVIWSNDFMLSEVRDIATMKPLFHTTIARSAEGITRCQNLLKKRRQTNIPTIGMKNPERDSINLIILPQ